MAQVNRRAPLVDPDTSPETMRTITGSMRSPEDLLASLDRSTPATQNERCPYCSSGKVVEGGHHPQGADWGSTMLCNVCGIAMRMARSVLPDSQMMIMQTFVIDMLTGTPIEGTVFRGDKVRERQVETSRRRNCAGANVPTTQFQRLMRNMRNIGVSAVEAAGAMRQNLQPRPISDVQVVDPNHTRMNGTTCRLLNVLDARTGQSGTFQIGDMAFFRDDGVTRIYTEGGWVVLESVADANHANAMVGRAEIPDHLKPREAEPARAKRSMNL